MKLAWLFNGTMQAHHLLAAYLIVLGIQGGYAAWVAVQSVRLRAQTTPPAGALPRDTASRT